ARAAGLLLERKAEQVVLAQHLDDVPGELALLVDLGGARCHALAGEVADQVADLALLLAQRVVRHRRIVCTMRSVKLAPRPRGETPEQALELLRGGGKLGRGGRELLGGRARLLGGGRDA